MTVEERIVIFCERVRHEVAISPWLEMELIKEMRATVEAISQLMCEKDARIAELEAKLEEREMDDLDEAARWRENE